MANVLRAAAVVILLSIASSAHAQTPPPTWLYRLSQGSALAAHGADGFATAHCLALETCHETNPALLRVTTQPALFGAWKMGIAGVSLWATNKIPNRTVATIANFAMTGFFTSIAIHNTRVAGRAR